MKNVWNQLPLLRILIPFIAGILASFKLDIDLTISPIVFISFGIFISLFILLYKRIIGHYSNRWIFGLFVNVLLFLFGYEMTNSSNVKNRPADFSHFRSTADTVIATISEYVSERDNSYKIVLEFNAVKRNDKWIPVSGKTMTYFAKDSLAKELQYGDQLIIAANFTDVRAPQNPGEFNYKRYLALKSVHTQGFVKSGKWLTLNHEKGNVIKSIALKIREKFLRIFETNNITGDEYAVAGALILGYTDKIDADLISIYQGTGALHILSVSGMHVGVVFIVLNFLLAFLDRFKRGKYIKSALLILLIWFYAAITGFSPAVNRAVAMITFVIVGKAFGRNTNIYNTLSASVLLLLIINPLLIADVGFQLSYIAVLGIVMLQKKICKLWVPGNWLLTQVWMIVSVSIAAQLATFPLAMLYFHQFPNYFLLTNLIVVPLSNFIIYCGMLVLFASPFGFLAELFAKLLVYMVYGLNESIRFIEAMPYSAIKGIQISTLETILLYFGMIFLIYYFIDKRKLFLKMAFIFAIIFSSSVAVKCYYSVKQKNIIIYNIKKSSAIDFIDGREHVLISDSALIKSQKDIAMHMQNNWCGMQLKEPENICEKKLSNLKFTFNKNSLFISGRFIQFYDKRFALVDEKNYRNTTDDPVYVDYLIISGNIKAEIGELLDSFKPKMIIIDSSNSLRKSEKWIKECAELNIPCYSVVKSGAFDISI